MTNTGMLFSSILPVETFQEREFLNHDMERKITYIDLPDVQDLAVTHKTLLQVLLHGSP